MRKSPTTIEFKQALSDERVKALTVAKWKPLHLMIYFSRLKMVDDIISFAGRSLRKALTLENKKTNTGDDFHPLKMCIKLKEHEIFNSLWNLANIWTVSHLYLVLKEMKSPDLFNTEIFK
jgi:hypothetical protein